MGEFAGYALDETMDAEDDRFRYRMGGMHDEEAYDLGIIDELGYYHHPPMFFSGINQSRAILPTARTCRYCGASGLAWMNTAHGWRLASSGVIHECGNYRESHHE